MQQWDIFCRVIDNYGDIGVCWRLARQLAAEYPIAVRLWVDDLTALRSLCPQAEATSAQSLNKVEVRHWPTVFERNINAADVVIEAFACELPERYLSAMALRKQQGNPPLWFNLEYLSAEDWVDDCHALNSIHPTTGLHKTFFFPGFSPRTGGLLCEGDLLAARDAFAQSTDAKTQFLHSLGITAQPQQWLISLFAYENPAIASLLETWQTGAQSILCLIPTGRILSSVNSALGTTLKVGENWQNGNLSLRVLPFLPQPDYDRLLWSCDLNFIRGEDSFVRAQWAAKPMIWHIYPQDEQAHMLKLAAFLERFTQTLSPDFKQNLIQLWQAWNLGTSVSSAWTQAITQYQHWSTRCQQWSAHCASLGDLAANLVAFCEKKATENPKREL